MAELVNFKKDKRVIFPTGEQYKFLLRAVNKLRLSWSELAKKVGVHRRTLNDWKREKYSIPLRVVQILSHRANVPIPSNIEVKDRYWYTVLGASAGAKAVLRKYGRIGGNPEYRKKKWCEWWKKIGRFNKNKYFVTKTIAIPQKNADLAEFVGIMIGDGGITKKQVIVSLNRKTEKLYSVFVKEFLEKLFQVKPSIYHKDKSGTDITISRTRLVAFCKSIGLKIGNKLKQDLDIPEWIRKDKNFEIPCIRGLVDTDGCIFNECHKIKGKRYCYPRFAFTSASKQLRVSVFEILKELDFTPRMRHNKDVQLENREEIIKYFKLIGTNNSNHLKRFNSFLGGVGSGCPKWS